MGSVRGHTRQGGRSGGRMAPSPSKQPTPQRSGKPNTVLQRRGLKTPSSLGNPVLPPSALGEFAVLPASPGPPAKICSWSFWVRLLACDVLLRGWAVYTAEGGGCSTRQRTVFPKVLSSVESMESTCEHLLAGRNSAAPNPGPGALLRQC